MAMVNMNNLLNGKDSRWLQLEVCREFQRNKCTRPDTECKFAHPPANVEVQNGRVTACYDSIKVCFHQAHVTVSAKCELSIGRRLEYSRNVSITKVSTV
ncbi:protein muscleblind isoform X15 [Lasioglossum baleicum]|uniref:protein muscleblind isoform X15 n=1 Tax=Lasioglossum baleicum TaxID=434251 RepID=UPI003FCE8B8B